MKRSRIAILLSAILILSTLAGCASQTVDSEVVVPKFDDKYGEVVFSAYASPHLNTKITPEVEEAYQKMAEAGITKAYALLEGQSSHSGVDVFDTIRKRSEYASEVALSALEFAEKYGIKYYVRDWSFYGLIAKYPDLTYEEYEKIIAEMFDENNEYIDHPAYGGNFAHDEPHVQQMEKIAWQVELYQKYIAKNSSTGGEIFVNLLPEYANMAQLSLTQDYNYGEYLDYYFENLAPMLGYISYDFYPFMDTTTGEHYVRAGYYHNNEIIAQKCKENDVEFRAFLQAKADPTGMRQLEHISDLRYQIYSGMAFGVREFIYFTYSATGDELDYEYNKGYACYDARDGEHTWLYDAAKEVHHEVLAMDEAYLAYKWDGIMYKNADDMKENEMFLNLESPKESHYRMEIVSCTQDVAAGVFEAKDEDNEAKDAFMFVNVTEPSDLLNSEVTVKFENTTALLMYKFGEEKVVTLGEDGLYTFILEPGEGRFVIPLK